MQNYDEYRNPYHSLETQREIAIGAVEFRDRIIENLRKQISNLRELILTDTAVETEEELDSVQFSHLKL